MIEPILLKHRKHIIELYSVFLSLEKQKSSAPVQPVEDGINRTPLFNMRKVLVDLPQNIFEDKLDIIKMMTSSATELAPSEDHQNIDKFKPRFQSFVDLYGELINLVSKELGYKSNRPVLKRVAQTAPAYNDLTRLTGNALISIVNELIFAKKNGLPKPEIQKVIDHLITSQSVNFNSALKVKSKPKHAKSQKLMRTIFTLIEGFAEDI